MAKGKEVIEVLAARFPQLYIAPAEGAQEAQRLASGCGIVLPGATLDHFVTSPNDELRAVGTPAGSVDVVFLEERADFETFLQIIGHKSQPVPIARTIGAKTYLGLADWGKVAAARESYMAAGGTDWHSEFERLAKEPGAFRTQLVVISEGPYSNTVASLVGYSEEEWLRVSKEIRLHHECAHVVCRRTMPDDVLPIWDELTADMVGLLCATGGYDAKLAALFLGVNKEGYTGGRLTEYLSEEQQARIDEVAREVFAACVRIEGVCGNDPTCDPFDLLLRMKAEPFLAY